MRMNQCRLIGISSKSVTVDADDDCTMMIFQMEKAPAVRSTFNLPLFTHTSETQSKSLPFVSAVRGIRRALSISLVLNVDVRKALRRRSLSMCSKASNGDNEAVAPSPNQNTHSPLFIRTVEYFVNFSFHCGFKYEFQSDFIKKIVRFFCSNSYSLLQAVKKHLSAQPFIINW